MSKRPVANTSTTTNTAEALANDVAPRNKKSPLSIRIIAIEENDPRETLKTIQQGTKYYFTHVNELLKVMGMQLEV